MRGLHEVDGRAPGPVLSRWHLRHRGIYEVVFICVGAILGALALWSQEPLQIVAAAGGGAVVVTLLLVVSAEVRGTTEETIRSTSQAYSQLEALLWLKDLLRLDQPLRPTRSYAAGPDVLLELVRVVDERRPKLVVELGSGVSTVVLAARVKGYGRIVSLDHLAEYADSTRAELARHGLDAEVVHAPLMPTTLDGDTWQWYDVPAGLDGIDMLVVDGPPASTGPMARYPAFPMLAARLSTDAVICIDDAARTDEREMVKRWVATEPSMQVRYIDTESGTCILTRH